MCGTIALMALKHGVDRAVAGRLPGLVPAVDVERDDRLLRTAGAGDDGERDQLDQLAGGGDLVLDQRLDVLVEDVLLAVGEILEAAEGVLEGVVAELEAELVQLLAEGVAAGMLAHDQRGRLHADVLGPHDLVGLRVLEHAVLVDAGFVGEGVLADDRLVVLHREGR